MAIALIYETHSTTVDNERGIATGWLPGQLSDFGRIQAEELGARRRGTMDAVITSDLWRAVETAAIALAGDQVPVHQDARLRECNYGDLNGSPVAEVRVRQLAHATIPFRNGESYRDVVVRTASLLADLALSYSGGARLLLIGHSANLWAIEHLLEGADLEDLIRAEFAWRPGWAFELPVGWKPGLEGIFRE